MSFPKYRRRADRDWAFVEHHGRRIRLPGSYGSVESRQAYAKFIAAIAREPAQTPLEGPDSTITDLCQRFLDHALLYYQPRPGRPATEYEHFRIIAKVLLFYCPDLEIGDFGPRALKEVRQLMITGRWTCPPRPWARTTINRQIGRLKRMLRWGVAEELVPPTVLQACEAVAPLRKGRSEAGESPPIQPVDLAHVRAVLPYVSSVIAAMIRLQMATGMRSQNVCGITPGQVDRSEEVWVYKPIVHKTDYANRQLIVFLGSRAQEALRPFLLRSDDAHCFSPQESAGHGRDHYDTTSYRQAVRYGIAKANRYLGEAIPFWTPHQLRHTKATEIRREFGVEAAQVFLGHCSADVTQVYAQRDLLLARRIAQQMA